MILDDVNAFFFGVLEFPRRCLEVRARATGNDFGIDATESARCATAIHRRVADTDDQDTLTDGFDVTKVHRAQPLDPDMDLAAHRVVPTTGNVEFFSFGSTTANKHRIVAIIEQRFQTFDRRLVPNLGAHVDDALRLFVEHVLGQAKGRNVESHQPARACMLLENHNLVAHWQQVVRDGE